MDKLSDTNPIIIFGAPRSGTNILRDILNSHKKISTWDCDEINPLWKYGNYEKNDDLKINDLSKKISTKIYEGFKKQQLRQKSEFIVEKTCANCIRPEFVHNIFPNAKFVLIFRNGFNVIPSAIKRWNGHFEGNLFKYRLKKLKYVPLLFYFYFFKNLLNKILTVNMGKSNWGPSWSIDLDSTDSIETLAFKQWRVCITSVCNYFKNFDQKKIFILKYEDLILNPSDKINQLYSFLDIKLTSEELFEISKLVSAPVKTKTLYSKFSNHYNEINNTNILIDKFCNEYFATK